MRGLALVASALLLGAALGCNAPTVTPQVNGAPEAQAGQTPIPPGPGTDLCSPGAGMTDGAACAPAPGDARAAALRRTMQHRYRQ
jgi:hypothetical protein